MEYTHEINLNLVPDGAIPVVRVKQGDASMRFIRATVYQGHDQVIPGGEQMVVFREEKPDGTVVLLDNTFEVEDLGRYLVVVNSDGSITIELVWQTTTCAGLCKCDLIFIQEDRVVSTATFIIDVEPVPNVAASAVSSDEFRTLIEALHDVGLSSTTQLSDMTDVNLDNVQDGQILVYDRGSHKWINIDITQFGYLTEEDVNDLIDARGYQTVTQINQLIADYIASLDGNDLEY